MDRDWNAEWEKIEADYRTAHAAVSETHEAVKPAPIAEGKVASTEDLAALGEAHKRFEAVKARRLAFIAERRISDPTWSS